MDESMSFTNSADKNLQIPLRSCDICGRHLTHDEQQRLAADTDFVEHYGHLVRSIAGRAMPFKPLGEGQ